MDELLTMSKKELSRLGVMIRLEEKSMKQQEAALTLGVSVRHVKPLLRAYRQKGPEGVISIFVNKLGERPTKKPLQSIHRLRFSRTMIRTYWQKHG